ncbi:chemotaxis protein CheX [Niallia sp. FSL W8-0635]|uniref:chemotaxis protein CheX n=1 Tax=Niallia sp. FSL W8-0635 TaxID=2975337 RepID=UPI0009D5BA75|nr:CheY-P phosphatase CheX [Mycobacteroides abscessus subsp. abscessus]HEO8421269.1 chemotaxis protein CheX [Yersinia enterocolitica]
MTLTKSTTEILNGTIEAVKGVIPCELQIARPALTGTPFVLKSLGVLIGITGDLRGRIIIDGDNQVFGKIGEVMFGMFLEGAMLESFSGELGNMIAGNLSTFVSQNGIEIDITPPTVLVGETKLSGFEKALSLPITLQNIGQLNIVLILEL